MKIGIIAEGRSDVAVLVNLLKGSLGLDRKDVLSIRPDLAQDETDRHAMAEAQFSNWGLVKQECIDRGAVDRFLEPFADERLLVIHIDTAEAELPGYDVKRPGRQDPDYAGELRRRVIEKINEWLGGERLTLIRHAVAVEEMDAWVLPLWSSHKDTSSRPSPKEDLKKALNKGDKMTEKARKKLFQLDAYERSERLSEPLRKRKTLEDCAARNASLRLFIESLGCSEPPEPARIQSPEAVFLLAAPAHHPPEAK